MNYGELFVYITNPISYIQRLPATSDKLKNQKSLPSERYYKQTHYNLYYKCTYYIYSKQFLLIN